MNALAALAVVARTIPVIVLAIAAGCEMDLDVTVSVKSADEAAAHPFTAALDEDDLAKFQALPPEFQDALREDSEEAGAGSALRYLRQLPDEVTPMAEVLPAQALSRFEELGPRFRRAVLLGYDEAFKERPGQDPADLPSPSAILAGMVDTARQMEFGDHDVFLPPMTETLSRQALNKLDSVDPSMRRAFQLVWNNRKALPEDVDAIVEGLQKALLAAPDAPPEVSDIGLSQRSLDLLDEIPDARRFVKEWLAAEVAQDAGWRSNAASSIDDFLGQFQSPEDRAALARLYMPATSGMSPLVCQFHPSIGVWPAWSLPEPFRDAPPNHLMAGWPSPSDALSPDALARFDSLAPQLQETFERDWYASGPLPMEARRMACAAMRSSMMLERIALREMPAMGSILSADALAEYENLPESHRGAIAERIARGILEGELVGPKGVVHLYELSEEEVLDALGAWTEAEIGRAALAVR